MLACVVERAQAEAPTTDLGIPAPPEGDSFVMAPATLRFVSALVAAVRPARVVEFGSGTSTAALAAAAARLGRPVAITSVDHDPEMLALAEQSLAPPAAEVSVTFVFAPLVVRRLGRTGKHVPVYLLGDRAPAVPADVIVVDGPPGKLGGREGTLYQALGLARAGTLVVFDDADRTAERRALRRWQENLGDAIAVREVPGIGRGVAVVEVRRPLDADQLERHRLELTIRELETVLPAGAQVCVLARERWAREVLAERPFVRVDSGDAFAGTHLVVGWSGFRALRRQPEPPGRALLDNERVKVYELASTTSAGA